MASESMKYFLDCLAVSARVMQHLSCVLNLMLIVSHPAHSQKHRERIKL